MENNNRMTWQTKWNWGAFVCWMFFAIGNRSWLAFLNLIPLFNLFWIFWTAAHAEQWALENATNDYRDEEEFRKIMDTYNRAGFVLFFIVLAILVVYAILFFTVFINLINQQPTTIY